MKKYQIEAEVTKEGLVSGLYQVLKEILLEVHGDEMDEDIRGCDLFTDNETVYIVDPGTSYLDELAVDERVAALVDTINVLLFGKVMKHKESVRGK
jgi:hypothetical protein